MVNWDSYDLRKENDGYYYVLKEADDEKVKVINDQ